MRATTRKFLSFHIGALEHPKKGIYNILFLSIFSLPRSLRRCVEDKRHTIITSSNNSSTTTTLHETHNTTTFTTTSVTLPLSAQTAIGSSSATPDIPSPHHTIVTARCEHPVVATLSCVNKLDLDNCLFIVCVFDVSTDGKVVRYVEESDTAIYTTSSQKSQWRLCERQSLDAIGLGS
jgi:hypothetical protein